jgi:small multidrug resistance family-3 protein
MFWGEEFAAHETAARRAMEILRSVGLFVIAGLCEIGGGYLIWIWLRGARSAWFGLVGGVILVIYGIIPTLQPAAFNFGRVYAAYGGVFIILSLLWGWLIDHKAPDFLTWLGP